MSEDSIDEVDGEVLVRPPRVEMSEFSIDDVEGEVLVRPPRARHQLRGPATLWNALRIAVEVYTAPSAPSTLDYLGLLLFFFSLLKVPELTASLAPAIVLMLRGLISVARGLRDPFLLATLMDVAMLVALVCTNGPPGPSSLAGLRRAPSIYSGAWQHLLYPCNPESSTRKVRAACRFTLLLSIVVGLYTAAPVSWFE